VTRIGARRLAPTTARPRHGALVGGSSHLARRTRPMTCAAAGRVGKTSSRPGRKRVAEPASTSFSRPLSGLWRGVAFARATWRRWRTHFAQAGRPRRRRDGVGAGWDPPGGRGVTRGPSSRPTPGVVAVRTVTEEWARLSSGLADEGVAAARVPVSRQPPLRPICVSTVRTSFP